MTQTLGDHVASDTTTDTMRAAVVTEFGGPLRSKSSTCHTRLR